MNIRNAGQSSLTTPCVPRRIQKEISAVGSNCVSFDWRKPSEL